MNIVSQYLGKLKADMNIVVQYLWKLNADNSMRVVPMQNLKSKRVSLQAQKQGYTCRVTAITMTKQQLSWMEILTMRLKTNLACCQKSQMVDCTHIYKF